MTNKVEYRDIIAFHPGYYINDLIEELGITQNELAKRLETSGKTVSKLINGQIDLSDQLAYGLSVMTGSSVDVWLNLQKAYKEKLLIIEGRKKMDEQQEVLDMMDYSYFERLGLVPKAKDKVQKILNLCSYFKISNLEVLSQPDLFASFKTGISNVQKKNIVNANAWVQTAINIGMGKEVAAFNSKRLEEQIETIRSMTLKEPNEFAPELNRILAECGVALIFLPTLKNSGINGAVKWVNDKVILALNDRRKYADLFWFALFHEIGHVMQKRKKLFISTNYEYIETDKKLEEEADNFARDTLIPARQYAEFVGMDRFYTREEITDFAKKISIHPGIVVGRLQHDRKVDFRKFNDMRIQYRITPREAI
ncbi:HigA family addiction module antitoxin [Gehongia tenuis]|uniref:HigA family addiction module antidote protein n=1 Tax=Gehongia tenuis TaxID=2763655 RepID=A0A926D5Q4_9FIRM|nr:HigA family addiction module antitoxin [Gehongia tenuis]MBC8531822.1 HigA family addiction module antidote protein [Gehongia tenuis]